MGRRGVFKLFAKGLLLLLIVSGIQWNLKRGKPDGILQQLDASLAARPHAVYLGDSTIAYCDGNDRDRRPITAILNSMLADQTIAGYANAAYHAEIYEILVDRILAHENRPRVIILPINLRSFSPVWDGDPATQTEVVRHKIALESSRWRRVVEPFCRAFGINQPRMGDRRAYMRQTVFCGAVPVGCVADFRGGSVDQQLTMNYRYPLTASHRKVQAFQRIAAKARAHRVRLVLYVTPIDYAAASEAERPQLVSQVQRNISVLHDVLDDHEVTIVDLSCGLASQHFHYDRHVNEHLKDGGRRYVAEELARICRPMF